MDTWTLLATAIALGTDTFAVGTAVGATLPVLTARHIFRLTWHFGLFQALMTVIGYFGGEALSWLMGGFNHWIAFVLLVFLGAKMLWESHHPEARPESFDPTRGWTLIGLSVATSIDALAVGVSLSLIGMTIRDPAIVIGVTALTMTLIGMRVGKGFGEYLGRWAERIGGVVLIAIGLRILMDQLVR